MDTTTELLTPDDVERDYKIAKNTQKAYRSRRLIPFIQVGPRMPRYRRADLEAWIESRAVAATGSR